MIPTDRDGEVGDMAAAVAKTTTDTMVVRRRWEREVDGD